MERGRRWEIVANNDEEGEHIEWLMQAMAKALPRPSCPKDDLPEPDMTLDGLPRAER